MADNEAWRSECQWTGSIANEVGIRETTVEVSHFNKGLNGNTRSPALHSLTEHLGPCWQSSWRRRLAQSQGFHILVSGLLKTERILDARQPEELRVKGEHTAVVCCAKLVQRDILACSDQCLSDILWRLNGWIQCVHDSDERNLHEVKEKKTHELIMPLTTCKAWLDWGYCMRHSLTCLTPLASFLIFSPINLYTPSLSFSEASWIKKYPALILNRDGNSLW